MIAESIMAVAALVAYLLVLAGICELLMWIGRKRRRKQADLTAVADAVQTEPSEDKEQEEYLEWLWSRPPPPEGTYKD